MVDRLYQERCHCVTESPSVSCKKEHIPTPWTMAKLPRACLDRLCPPAGPFKPRFLAGHPSAPDCTPRRHRFAPSRPQHGPRPLRCHRGKPAGHRPCRASLRTWNMRYSLGRKRNKGDGSRSQTGMRVTPRHNGMSNTSLHNGGVTNLPNQINVKWGGRPRHELLLPAWPMSFPGDCRNCKHSPLLRERLP